MKLRLWVALLIAVVGAATLAVCTTDHGEALAGYLYAKARGGYSVDQRLAALSAQVLPSWQADFAAAQVPFPPTEVSYVAFKDSRKLEVYARAQPDTSWHRIRTYPILGLSGQPGPKLREGDGQVPEGLYRAEFLNPNGRFHVSIRLNYPNAFDRRQAQADGRTQLGRDIMIHGTASSVGCLAVGNRATEALFALAALVGKEQVRILISPTDSRQSPMPTRQAEEPAWLPGLYEQIQRELLTYPGAPA